MGRNDFHCDGDKRKSFVKLGVSHLVQNFLVSLKTQ